MLQERSRMLLLIARSVLVLLLLQCFGANAAIVTSYDFDDNIVILTKDESAVLLKPKPGHTGPVVRMTTGEFALQREKIGKTEPYRDYSASYEEMSDPPTGADSNLVRSIRKAIARWEAAGKDPLRLPFKGPAWDHFVNIMSTKKGANSMSIITARAHESSSLRAGLQVLRDAHLIKYIPDTDQSLYGVSSTQFKAKYGGGSLNNPSAAKVQVMMDQLDELQKEADRNTYLAHWSFSDDDPGNVKEAYEAFKNELTKNPRRWNKVRIKLIPTGSLEGLTELTNFQKRLVVEMNCNRDKTDLLNSIQVEAVGSVLKKVDPAHKVGR
jgi:hypothetical protein